MKKLMLILAVLFTLCTAQMFAYKGVWEEIKCDSMPTYPLTHLDTTLPDSNITYHIYWQHLSTLDEDRLILILVTLTGTNIPKDSSNISDEDSSKVSGYAVNKWTYSISNNIWTLLNDSILAGTNYPFEQVDIRAIGRLSNGRCLILKGTPSGQGAFIYDIDNVKLFDVSNNLGDTTYRLCRSFLSGHYTKQKHGYVARTSAYNPTIKAKDAVSILMDSIELDGSVRLYSKELSLPNSDFRGWFLQFSDNNYAIVEDPDYSTKYPSGRMLGDKCKIYDLSTDTWTEGITVDSIIKGSILIDNSFLNVAPNIVLMGNGNPSSKSIILRYDSLTRTIYNDGEFDFTLPKNFLTMAKINDTTFLYLTKQSISSGKLVGQSTLQETNDMPCITMGTYTLVDRISSVAEAPTTPTTPTTRYLGNNIYQTDFLQSAELYDVLGICVCKYNNTNMIDISEFARGIYFLKTKDYCIKLFKY
jgi:hypothetical protein